MAESTHRNHHNGSSVISARSCLCLTTNYNHMCFAIANCNQQQLSAARACLERAAAAVAQLRLEESSDPPIPVATATALETAESDLALLRFKCTAVAATASTAASATAVGLTAAALQSLLAKEVLAKAQQPAALLELLLLCSCGQTGVPAGLLAVKDASAVVEVLCTVLASSSEVSIGNGV
jgi:hypothetical protein